MRGRGVFDDEEDVVQQKSSGDAEFTLGAGTLVLVLSGLIVICGMCFGLGYLAGRRGPGSQTAAAPQAVDAQTGPQINGSQQKPSAISQAQAAAPAETQQETDGASNPANSPQPAATDGGAGSSAQSSIPASAPATAQSTRQAAPQQATTQQSTQPTRQLKYKPAVPQTAPDTRARPDQGETQSMARPETTPAASGLWVQVAAVSHVEDAQVLTAALRRRGYVVTPRRETDNLIHVRIGPFNTRDEANRWSMKLLDDGYNAEVQQ
jgi:cell division septation protein DedD